MKAAYNVARKRWIKQSGWVNVVMVICNCEFDGVCLPGDWRYNVLVWLYKKGKRDVQDGGA